MSWFEVANVSWLEKLAQGLKRLVTFMVPVVGVIQFIIWYFKSWWASLIQQFLEKVDSALNEVSIAIGWGELNIPWAKINSVVPLTEMISLMITFKAIVIALIIIKWLRNTLPFFS